MQMKVRLGSQNHHTTTARSLLWNTVVGMTQKHNARAPTVHVENPANTGRTWIGGNVAKPAQEAFQSLFVRCMCVRLKYLARIVSVRFDSLSVSGNQSNFHTTCIRYTHAVFHKTKLKDILVARDNTQIHLSRWQRRQRAQEDANTTPYSGTVYKEANTEADVSE